MKTKLKSIWFRDIAKMSALDFENALGLQDLSSIYESNDPNDIHRTILSNVNSSLDKLAPFKEIKIRKD